MTPEHERYVWLRDSKSYYRGYCGSAPFVISPNKSRLYTIAEIRAEHLDIEIDADILNTTLQNLHDSNEVVEQGLMVGPIDRDGYEYSNILYALAQSKLGWDDVRVSKAKEFK